MYLRRCYRHKDGKRHAYWALVESYRTNRGPRQRVVAWLGVMDERGRRGVKRCAEKNPGYQTGLFATTEPEWVEIDVKRVPVERSRKFGGPWLGRELLRPLELDRFLEEKLPNRREEIPWSAMAMILILGRLCEPSSELHLAEHLYQASALSDLLGVPDEKVNEDRLYRALDTLLPHKKALEKLLKERLGELFDLDYDLLLYDITSTYFEGQAEGNPQANEVLPDGVSTAESVLLSQSLVDSLGSVALFPGPLAILLQDHINHSHPRIQLRSLRRLLPPIAWRDRILQHLSNGLTRQPILPGHLPLAFPLNLNRSPNSCI